MNPSPWNNPSYEALCPINLRDGAFGQVFKARHKIDKTDYAVKKIAILLVLKYPEYEGQLEKLLREVKIPGMLNCENIVKYFTCWIEGPNLRDGDNEDLTQALKDTSSHSTPADFLYVVFELCDMDLRMWLDGHPTLEERKADVDIGNAFKQLSIGLKAMHDVSIVHRDLKPSNILLQIAPVGRGVKYVLKIGDLGLSKVNTDGDDFSSYQKGNPNYYSRRRDGPRKDEKDDVFALGLIFVKILYPLASEVRRWTTFSDIDRTALSGLIIDNLFKKSPSYTDFRGEVAIIKKMLVHDKEKRWGMNQVLASLEALEKPSEGAQGGMTLEGAFPSLRVSREGVKVQRQGEPAEEHDWVDIRDTLVQALRARMGTNGEQFFRLFDRR